MIPIVSIILPNYNHAAYLKERLDSIINQTYQNFELIILDDASTDNSIEILNKYSNNSKVSHFIINKKNTGSPFKQWKKGLNLAVGDYIWIAESDDFCELNFLETQLNLLSNTNKDIVVAETVIFDKVKTGKKVNHPIFKETLNKVITSNDFFYCPILNVSAIVFKKNNVLKLEDAEFFKYNIIGDKVFYFEFFNYKIITYNNKTTSYFRHNGSGLSNLKSKNLQYFNKYFSEHISLINIIKKEDDENNGMVKPYIKKFFNRVRDRTSYNKKISLTYLFIYLKYKYNLLTN